MSPFTARFDSRCRACAERIHEGDQVTYRDDQLVHADCDTAAPAERQPRPMCPDCFTELPATGVCGSCE